jgi:hypothetical protein
MQGVLDYWFSFFGVGGIRLDAAGRPVPDRTTVASQRLHCTSVERRVYTCDANHRVVSQARSPREERQSRQL